MVGAIMPSCVECEPGGKTRGRHTPGFLPLSESAAPAASATTAGPWATPATIATPAPRTALGLRARFVDDEITVSEQPTVEHLDRLGRFLLGGHLHEPESARPPGELVRDDADRFNGAGLSEQLAQILLRGLEREITDEELCRHRANLLPSMKAAPYGTCPSLPRLRGQE